MLTMNNSPLHLDVEYMKEGDHTLYIGILLIFISVIIYIFNISGI